MHGSALGAYFISNMDYEILMWLVISFFYFFEWIFAYQNYFCCIACLNSLPVFFSLVDFIDDKILVNHEQNIKHKLTLWQLTGHIIWEFLTFTLVLRILWLAKHSWSCMISWTKPCWSKSWRTECSDAVNWFRSESTSLKKKQIFIDKESLGCINDGRMRWQQWLVR